jgi:hypothetical protein
VPHAPLHIKDALHRVVVYAGAISRVGIVDVAALAPKW